MGKKESLSIIAIGDVHIREEYINVLNQMKYKLYPVIRNLNPDLIILLGDILHTHETIHSDSLNAAITFIRELSVIGPPLVVLIGNHDLINNQQFLTDKHGFNALKKWKNVTIVDTCIHRIIKGHRLIFTPYVFPGRFIEALDTNEKPWNKATVIFGHQEFYGCKMSAITSHDGDKWDPKFPLVITGHIHDAQILGKNVIYPGTPIQHGFGDTGKKTIAYFKFDSKKKYIYERINLGLPRKRTLTLKLPDANDVTIDKVERYIKRGDKVKCVVQGTKEQFSTFKKSGIHRRLHDTKAKIQFKAIREKRVEIPKDIEDILFQDEEDNGDDRILRIKEDTFIGMLKLLIDNENQSTQNAFNDIFKRVT